MLLACNFTRNELLHNLFFPQCLFFFKNYSLVEVIHLLIRCNKTKFLLQNTNNTDRNSVNKQNTHTYHTLREWWHWKGLVNMKIIDTHLFLNTPYFTNLSLFMGKNMKPLFQQNFFEEFQLWARLLVNFCFFFWQCKRYKQWHHHFSELKIYHYRKTSSFLRNITC